MLCLIRRRSSPTRCIPHWLVCLRCSAAPPAAQNVKGQQLASDKLQLEREIHLVKAPAAQQKTKEKLRMAAEQRQVNEPMQE